MSSSAPIARRVHLSRDHIAELDKDQLVAKWYQQEAYINQLESATEELSKQADSLQHELQSNEMKYKKRLHNVCMKLTLRDRKIAQFQEKLDQIAQNQGPSPYQLESTLVDPALNLMFEKMKNEVEASKVKVEEMQNELSAWKFTPDSTTGKRLMAKCRLLHNENEELGKEMSTGWVAQLTGNLALQKKFSEEMKKSQIELDEFLLELEEEVEGMQNTIYYLQQQLKEAKENKPKNQITDQEDQEKFQKQDIEAGPQVSTPKQDDGSSRDPTSPREQWQILLLLVSQVIASHSSTDTAASPSNTSPVVSQPQSSSNDVSSAVGQSPSSSSQAQQSPASQAGGSSVVEPSGVVPPSQYHSAMTNVPMVGHYAPAGMIQVIGNDQMVSKQQPVVRSFEQYGQPEPSPLPPGYKPFGSWGLYIGGNPADGYYTNYYKALANSVDKQQVSSVEPQSGAASSGGQSSGMKPVAPAGVASATPMYKQAISSSPSSQYVGSDYYPFAYSPSEFNAGSSPVVGVHSGVVQMVPQPQSSSSSSVVGGQQIAGPTVGGVSSYSAGVAPAPASVSSSSMDSVSSYSAGSVMGAPEMYAATKRAAGQSPYTHKGEMSGHSQQQQQVVPPSPAKGYYQSRFYSYQAPASAASGSQSMQSTQVQQSHQQAATAQPAYSGPYQQVVAYPVPVGSQMVGSQPGIEGAFAPYGVHAFTRYAVKPTMVSSSDQGYYYTQVYSPMASQSYPAYKQQMSPSAPAGVVPPAVGYGQPMSFYGYPMTNQLHYSAGPMIAEHQHQHPPQPIAHMSPPVQAETAEKSEAEDKQASVSSANKQQQHKRA